MSRKTLGQLIHKFEKHIELRAEIEETLAAALEERNYVIHNFFSDRIEKLATPIGRKDGLQYLAEAWRTIAAGTLAVHEFVPKLMAASGLDPGKLSRAARNAFEP